MKLYNCTAIWKKRGFLFLCYGLNFMTWPKPAEQSDLTKHIKQIVEPPLIPAREIGLNPSTRITKAVKLHPPMSLTDDFKLTYIKQTATPRGWLFSPMNFARTRHFGDLF